MAGRTRMSGFNLQAPHCGVFFFPLKKPVQPSGGFPALSIGSLARKLFVREDAQPFDEH